jgi:transposase
LTSDPRLAAAHRAQRYARDTEVLALHADGATIRAIARRMHLTRWTVRRIVRAGTAGAVAGRALPAANYRSFEPNLWRRWTTGCRNARQLWEEIRAQGYASSEVHLRRALRTWRTTPAPGGRVARAGQTAPASAGPPPPRLRSLSPRQAAWLLVRDRDALDTADQALVDQLLATAPALHDPRDLAHAFRDLVRRRDAAGLETWLTAAAESASRELRAFAGGVRRDLAAVTAALEWDWSNGQTEGHVNKLKLLKRAMFGRGKDDLLRLRLLHAA